MSKIDNTPNVNEISRISAGTMFRGEMSSQNDIRIDGAFEGKLFSKGKVVIGEKAHIKGDVVCENVDFWGTMEGAFYVKDTLTLRSASKVNGDLHIRKLQVELDANFDGTCHMITEADFEKVINTDPMKPATHQAPESNAKK